MYTKNQNFRLIHSAKFQDLGKRHFKLKVKDEFIADHLVTTDVFLKTLASYTGDCHPNSVMTLKYGFVKEPLNKNMIAAPRVNLRLNNNMGVEASSAFPKVVRFFEKIVISTWGWVEDDYYENFNNNPEVVAKTVVFNKTARISKVTYHKNNEIIVISVYGNKYCKNIRKSHTNNGIFFIINVVNMSFTQTCHSNLCNKFRSRSIGLDPALFFSLKRERCVKSH